MELRVQHAYSSNHNRPAKTSKNFYWRDRLMTGLYVGDGITFISQGALLPHHGTVVGHKFDMVEVLFENMMVMVNLEQITHLNGCEVRDDHISEARLKGGDGGN